MGAEKLLIVASTNTVIEGKGPESEHISRQNIKLAGTRASGALICKLCKTTVQKITKAIGGMFALGEKCPVEAHRACGYRHYGIISIYISEIRT
jgi:hypothetical protein